MTAVKGHLNASELVLRLRSGTVTAEDVVSEALGRASKYAKLNAFLAIEADVALTEARRVDRARRNGECLPALAGLPVCVKDNIDIEGWATTGATRALATFRPNRTAHVVRRLQQAGAIVIGKTNLHELAFGITNTNFGPDFPPARNPCDPDRITGGSSGGTAAAIAAGIVPAGLGTDTSGSIRIPAALCGIAGLRPSVGDGGSERRYPVDGVLPISRTNDTVGPMAVSVGDLALLDEAITGKAAPAPARLDGLRLGLPDSFWEMLDPEVEAICRRFCAHLEGLGVVLSNVSLPGLRPLWEKVSAPVVLHEPAIDIPAYLAAGGRPDLDLAELAGSIVNPDVRSAFEAVLSGAFAEQYRRAISVHRPALRALYEATFRDHALDGLIFPTVPVPAIPIDLSNAFGELDIPATGRAKVFDTYIRNTDPGANAGLPGLSFPVGTTRAGLPVGIEIDGWIGADRHVLAMGMAFERTL
ncbi:amidase family protein [Mesorhizobium sp. L-8-3]|uniref:amidase family protein n=1 Tax=Mesorhizobium sp. L-8-3 TaxID=2744522 RepID=UPI001927D727|nr:amidase family protein [Mesorhizobium sp. L-8-3]BCH27928.1 indole acetimide hydrolase [Mesorhizobium sp. L-8-3]